jgi:hypothetical protein
MARGRGDGDSPHEGATELTEFVPTPQRDIIVIPTIMSGSILTLLKDRSILIIAISIWLTTSAMSVLEPTLPIWLIDTINPSVTNSFP